MALTDLKAETLVLGNKQFKIEPFTMREGLPIQAQLLDVISPSLSVFTADEKAQVSDVLPQAISTFCQKLQEHDVLKLAEKLLSRTYVDDRKLNLDRDLSGEYMTFYELIYKVVEVNFGNFLSAAIGKLNSNEWAQTMNLTKSANSDKN